MAKGADLKTIYQEAMAALRPRFGHWVIFDHCMPFNVSRAFDEATGHDRPRIWTAERDVEMWQALEAGAAQERRHRALSGAEADSCRAPMSIPIMRRCR